MRSVPLSCPFSKSSPSVAIELVTWATHTTSRLSGFGVGVEGSGFHLDGVHSCGAGTLDRSFGLAERCIGGPAHTSVDGLTEVTERAVEEWSQTLRDCAPFARREVAVAGAFGAPGAFDEHKVGRSTERRRGGWSRARSDSRPSRCGASLGRGVRGDERHRPAGPRLRTRRRRRSRTLSPRHLLVSRGSRRDGARCRRVRPRRRALQDHEHLHDATSISTGSCARCHSGKPSASRSARRPRRRRRRTASSAITQYGPRQ